jgi:hypothetical protein
MHAGTYSLVVWSEEGEPEAVLMSATQYRDLRGDSHPPTDVVDDPTTRVQASEPLSDSRPFDVDEWAADDPYTQQRLNEIRVGDEPPEPAR